MSRLSRLLGEEDDDKSIIPATAKPFTAREERDTNREMARQLASPSAKEPLIDPEVALVAPDATPNATVRLSPHQVPASEETTPPAPSRPDTTTNNPASPNAISVMLGRARGDNAPTPSVIPGIPSAESFAASGDGIDGAGSIVEGQAAAKAALAAVPGSGMPDPAPRTDGSNVYNAFRRLGGPR